MTLAGKFTDVLPDAQGAHLGGHAHVDSVATHAPSGAIVVPDAHLLFSGDFQRSGSDLIISDDHHRVVVPDYFHGSKHPALVSPEGAPLDPKVIEALTGHTAYAQAGGAPAAKVVGHVASMTGSASIVRNGVTVVLNNGDAVYQSDVVQTGSGSTLGLVLIDGTTFKLAAGARLMLNDLTYDATSTSNSALFTLVQGAASFVAGQVAKTGDMKVGTPIATMGIRGTAVILDISSVDGRVSMSVVDQHDGLVHAVQVFNARGDLIGTVTSNGSSLTLTPTATFEVIAQESNKTVQQIAQEFNAFQTLLGIYDIQRQIDPNLPQHTENNANPQTRYASFGSTPASSPQTEYHGPTGTGPGALGPGGDTSIPVVFTVPSPDGAPGGTPTQSPSDPIVVVKTTVPVTSIPFPVTPATVSPITTGPIDHSGPAMSASGNVVYDPDGIIYFYDRATGATIRVSADDGLTYSGQTISSDGRYVVYQGTDGTHTYVYVWGSDPADAAHYHVQTRLVAGGAPAISGDGSTILVEQAGSSIGIFDLQGHPKGTITPAAIGASGTVWSPSISADGNVIAFWSSDSTAAGASGHLYTYNVSTGVVADIASTATGAGTSAASISADGHYVVYQSTVSGRSEIYLYDTATHHVIFSTADAPETLAGASRNPVISPDGHFIAFTSDAQLTVGDTNAFADTYVVDVTHPGAPVYKLVSEHGNAASDGGVAISAGGLYVAFASGASFSGGNGGSSNIFVADSSSGHSAIIQETANSPANLTASGVVVVTGGVDGVTLSVSDLAGNPTDRFHAAFDSNGNIRWNFSEAKSDFSSLQYGQDASQQFVITLIFAGGTTKIPVTVSVHDAIQPVIVAVNAAPTINSATLTVSEGDTVVFGSANIGISDANDSSFTFKVTGVSHGQFQVFADGQWKNTATFTSAELAGSLIRFIHDGSEFAPTFAIQADDGHTINQHSNILTGSVNFTHVNDAPAVKGATLVVARGDTVVLHASNLNITHTDSFADFSGFSTRADLPAFSSGFGAVTVTWNSSSFSAASLISVNDPDSSSFTFTVTNVTHGVFQILADGETWVDATTFTSADLNAGHVRFARENSDDTPTFSIQADDGAAANHASSVFTGTVSNPAIVIDFIPTITAASLTVSEGGTILVAPADIAVTDADDTSFTFTVTNVAHGTFQTSTDGIVWTTGTQFTTADLNAHHVRFIHDGGEAAPTFSIQANDGIGVSDVFTGSVTFTNVNDAPIAAPVTLAAGTEDHSYVITPEALLGGVSDIDGPSLTITDVTINSGGGSIFLSETGSWTYTPASNYHGPVSFNYTVSDGSLTASSTASLTLTAVNHAPTVSGPVTGTVTEDGTPGFLNALANASDADGDTLAVVNVPTTLPAGVHYNGELQSFFLDPSDPAFQHLGANDTATISVSYGISDGHVTVPGSVSWTVHGLNDAPVIAAGTVSSGAIDVSAATAKHNTLSPELVSELHVPGLISGLPGASESGFGTLALGPSDDGSSGAINITSVFGAAGVNFFGHNYTSLYVNNNGNITFHSPSSTFTPSVINAGLNNPIIAAFWADVDTRPSGGGHVYYDLDTSDGVMTITWDHVGYYSQGTNKLDSFQLVLINEGNGNFDIEYRYGNIQWTAGSASGGSNGLSGTPARAGYSAGDGTHYFELPQSGIQAALLSLSSTPGNTGIAGVDHLEVHNGEVGLTTTGAINFSDPDVNDVHAVQSVTYTGGGNELGTLTLVKATDTTGTGTGGQFVWTYTADPAAVRAALDSTSLHSKVETFDVVIGDGHGGTLTRTVSVTLTETGTEPTVTITVLTPDGLDFHAHNSLKEMGGGTLRSGGSSTSFTILNSTADREFVIDGTNFTYSDGAVTGGTVTSFHEFKADGTTALADFTGLSVNAATWMSAVQQDAHGDNTAAEALTSAYAYNFIGGAGPDSFGAAGHADTLSGTGSDFFDGGGAPAGSHDTLTGGAGSTFVFAQGYGALTITNFDQASGAFNRSDGDHIQLDGFTGRPAVTYVNGNTIADFGNGDVLTLLNVNPENIHDSDFIGNNDGGNNDGNGNGNNGPVLSNADNTVTYTGTPVFLDPSIAVTDATGTVSSVNVWISSGFHGGDTFTINGTGDGDILNADGSTIHYHFDNTTNPDNPSIFLSAFNGSPTSADFDAALQLIQFSPGAADGDRTVTWAAYDNVLHSPTVTTTIDVGPILNSFTLTVSQGGTTVLSNTDFNVSDPGFTDLTYTVNNVTGGHFEVNEDGWHAAPTGGFTTAQIAAGNVEFVQDGTATVPDFLIHVSDPGNASPDIAPTVSLVATDINHAPVFDGADLAPIYHHGDAAVALTGNVSASDIDSANYAGGTLTATEIGGGHEGDTLSIVANEHISLIVASGTTVMYDSDGVGGDDPIAIGSLSNYDYNSLTVTLNGNAGDAAVAALTEAIKFSNSTPNPIADTRTVAFTLHDGGGIANGGQDSDYFETHVTVPERASAAPVIHTDQISVSELGDGITRVSGLYVTDTDATETETFNFTATTGASPGSSVGPSIDPGHLVDINTALETGVTYNPGENPQPLSDSVRFTVTDGSGRSDAVNFIFNVSGQEGITLTGTPEKDVFFGTESRDQFVFAAGSNHDTIVHFTSGQDHIDLSAVVTTDDRDDWFRQHVAVSPTNPQDMLVTIDAADTIVLRNVTNLSANDFILHPGGHIN